MRVGEVALFHSFLVNSHVSMPVNLSECVCVCACPWLTISASTSPANEFKLWASVLWPGFIPQKDTPLLQLESSLWPWQTVICRESTSLEFSFCYWLQWIELSMCWKYWNPPNYWHDSEEPAYCCPAWVFLFFFKSLIVFALFSRICVIISVITCAPPQWRLNPLWPGPQSCRTSEPFVCCAVSVLPYQLIQTSAQL